MLSIPEELREEVLRQMPSKKSFSTQSGFEHSVASSSTSMEEGRRCQRGDQSRSEVLVEDEAAVVKNSYKCPVTQPALLPSVNDLALAPSTILPHKTVSRSDLRDLLRGWERAAATQGEEELAPAQKQALISFAIWLVKSKQLAQVTNVLLLIQHWILPILCV